MVFLYEGKLNDLDMSIAQKIEGDPTIITGNNIFEAASILGVSASKLTKYCQKINLGGFKEIKYKLYQLHQSQQFTKMQSKNDFNIKSVICSSYHLKLLEIPKLFTKATKIIIITQVDKFQLGLYIAAKIRQRTHKHVVAYNYQSEYSFEYLNEQVLTIIIDEHSSIKCLEPSWYRPGNSYVHIAPTVMSPHPDYYPLATMETNINLPFDAVTLLIINWLIKH